MKIIKKVCAGLMLSFGVLFLMVSVSALSDLNDENNIPEETQEAQDTLLGGIVLGVPLTAGGGYMFWGLRRRNQKELSDRLDTIFYQIIQANHGKITVLQMAMEAKLPGKQAKEYLNEKSQEFNASFEPTDQGDITYLFHI
ncbi:MULTISPECIES: hypothetical protein [unclassified Nodularia (in: cyanobacteria)]|uniref:hypothetical protein n=1 Tax=unclassified Nodularia (in: cyanobacteria) TaxID=2656917 RepID=UPI00187F913E|nr:MULTISPECIES: hypothetical protein [unclassified Nodularia (in: cyanobacteria)]MBE9199557.1 hypothetical protein [Nodularia sp. LEGE 06071]MCC2691370.1 hypothetical protein [Nodularia sp. LEGE 04288]